MIISPTEPSFYFHVLDVVNLDIVNIQIRKNSRKSCSTIYLNKMFCFFHLDKLEDSNGLIKRFMLALCEIVSRFKNCVDGLIK